MNEIYCDGSHVALPVEVCLTQFQLAHCEMTLGTCFYIVNEFCTKINQNNNHVRII